jgi:hypothetical protein
MTSQNRLGPHGIPGHKRTAQRDAILKVLLKSGRSLTAKEVWVRARERHPSVGQDTVYRNLLLLVETGDVAQTHLQKPVRLSLRGYQPQATPPLRDRQGCGKGLLFRPG